MLIKIGVLFRQIIKELQAQDKNPNSYLNNSNSEHVQSQLLELIVFKKSIACLILVGLSETKFAPQDCSVSKLV